MAQQPPFKVKAVFEYTSEHDDDLKFPNGQIITVIDVEDDDWYSGEYTDSAGLKHEGLFPKNFVEPYEPPVPSRPVRTKSKKEPGESDKLPTPVVPMPAPVPAPAEEEPEDEDEDEPVEPALSKPAIAQSPPAPAATFVQTVAKPAPAERSAPAPAAAPIASSKPAPPEVSDKPSGGSFRDRIAAFNKSSAPPIAPFKPSNLGNTSFIKKPFVAPPPSRDAYVPPPREPVAQTVYRREEDPSVIQQEADKEEAEKILSPTTAEGEEDQPKPTSLKERIALLQKQQLEQAQRHAEAAERKEKKKPPPKPPRAESLDEAPREEGIAEDTAAVAPPLPKSRREAPAESALQSDGNEADHSAAGETEEAEDVSTDPENERTSRPPPPPLRSPRTEEPAEAEEDEPGSEEEDEDIDPEVRRRMELRERMAKVSGGMGMHGMFGSMPMAAPPPKPKRAEARPRDVSDEQTGYSNAPPVPVMALPGMAAAARPPPAPPRPQQQEEEAVESEDDRDDARTPTSPPPIERRESGAPPVPTGSRPAPTARLPPAPPSEARPAPPPPPRAVMSPSEGSESDDELSSHARGDSSVPGGSRQDTPVQVPRRSTSDTLEGPTSPAPSSNRLSRAIPPIPGLAGLGADAPPARPPPLPQSNPPAARKSLDIGTAAAMATAARGNSEDEVTEYEGDYDTDIGNAEKHKDALTAHTRQPNLEDDESTRRDRPQGPRAAPPPLPTSQPPTRRSTDMARPPPPPIPQSPRQGYDEDEEEDYDPYRYTSGRPAPGPTSPLTVSRQRTLEGDEAFGAIPPRPTQQPPMPSQDRPPPPPPPADRPAPPLPPQQEAVDDAPKSRQMSRTSTDEPRMRRSTDQARPGNDHAFIAGDIDLGEHSSGSKWWSQQNALPATLSGRKDILYEFEEQTSSRRDGTKSVTKDLYVVYPDYSKSTFTVSFDPQNPDRATSVDQRHDPPPPQPRQDQLEQAYDNFGSKLAKLAESKSNSVVGDGEPQTLVMELFKSLSGVLAPIGTRSFGAPVYTNLANASVQQFDEIRPGDIISLRNAKFQGHRGAVHSKYAMDVGKPDHVGVVVDWDGTKKKIRAWEQGRENKKVKVESFKMGDLKSGEVKVWRVMPRSWIGWVES